MDVFDELEFDYYTTDMRTESKYLIFSVSDMIEKKMMIETRTRYPSDKLTFTIADIVKQKSKVHDKHLTHFLTQINLLCVLNIISIMYLLV